MSVRKATKRSPPSPVRLQLVAENRREAERDGLPAQDLEQRQVHVASASHSHSSPKGQVPKPST